MHLTIRQMETFREVIRTGSISGAARHLGRTQPAVSAMISGLEAELGLTLFERGAGRFESTPEARFFLEEVEEILGRIDRTRTSMQNLAAGHSGTLRLACHPAASGVFMPAILSRFLEGRPDVEASLYMRSSKVIEDQVAAQDCDIGLVETPLEPRTSFLQQDFTLEYLCALPADDPLCARDVITPEDLDNRPMAMLFSEHESYGMTASAFAEHGCTLRRRFELRTLLPGLTLVASGQCCMICDMITAHSYLQIRPKGQEVVFRRFRPIFMSHLSILTPSRRPISRLAQSFHGELSAAISELSKQWDSILPPQGADPESE